MKVIFLDIDGVLNSRGTATLEKTYIDRLKRIIDETGALLVLTSSWKDMIYHPDIYGDFEKKQLDTLMNKSGLKFAGVTPDINEEKREIEIMQWLGERIGRIESFVIIDDLPYKFDEKFPNKFVRTGGYLGGGISDKNVEDAIKILNGEG